MNSIEFFVNPDSSISVELGNESLVNVCISYNGNKLNIVNFDADAAKKLSEAFADAADILEGSAD